LARSDTSPQRETPPAGRRVEPLTEIERKILDYMVQYLRANTYQPSIREIGERFGIKSTKTVSEHLQALADKGCLERDPSRSRGVRILGVDLTDSAVSVPYFQHVPAEQNGLLRQQAEMHVSIDRRLAGKEGCFFLRAGAGDLAVLGVHEGDWLLVEPADADELVDGAIVLAAAGSGSLFHRFARNGKGFRLESLRPGGAAGADGRPNPKIIGRVTAFYRRMDEAGPLNLTPH
jgi:repressor LexA